MNAPQLQGKKSLQSSQNENFVLRGPSAHFPFERRSWHRAIASAALGASRRGDAASILKRNWPQDDRAALILRAATTPTNTAAFPVHDIVAAFRSIAPGSAAFKLFEHSSALKLDLTGLNSIAIPSVTTWPQPAFVAEGAPAPTLQWQLGKTILGPTRKILILAAASHELQDAVPDTAAAVIGRIMADAAAKAIDTVAFDSNPGDTTRPPGLLFGATPITAAAAGVNAMADDLANLTAAIGSAGIDTSDVVFICTPRASTVIEAQIGARWDNLILPTLGLPAKTICAFAPAGIVSGYIEPPAIETAREPSFVFNDVPTETVTSGGIVGAPSKSAFQEGLIGIRLRARLAWAVLNGAAQIIQNINW